MLNTIQKFVWREILKSCGFVALCLMGLQVVITLVSESAELDRGSYAFIDSLWYSLQVAGPGSLVFILPIVMLIGLLLALGKMVENAEMVVLLSSGMSRLMLFITILPLCVVISVSVMLLEDQFLLGMRNQAVEHRNFLRTGKSITSGSLAVKIADHFVVAERINEKGELAKVKVFTYDENFSLVSQASAATGMATDKRISLNNPQIREYADEQITMYQSATITLAMPHTLQFLRWLGFGALKEAERFSLAKLRDFAQFQSEVNMKKNPFLLVFYNKLLLPVNVLAFMLLVFPFIFGSTRSTSISTKIILGIMVGLVFVNFQQLTLPIHMVFGIHPFVVAVFPAFITIIGAGVFMRVTRE